MLTEWLEFSDRGSDYYTQFDVTDIAPNCEVSTPHTEELVNLVQEAMVEPDFLASLAQDIGWSNAHSLFVDSRKPVLDNVKKGDFGEAFTSGFLQQYYNYEIPVQKLRFKISRNQTLPGTDVLALKLNTIGEVQEACYVEAKVSTRAKSTTAVEAYHQLVHTSNEVTPSMLTFILLRLAEGPKGNLTHESFKRYLLDRKESTDKDSYLISLCWERSSWRENVLENLEQESVRLPQLSLKVTQFDNLETLCNSVFASLGVTEVNSDE